MGRGMQRRGFLVGLGSALALGPNAANAQRTARMRRIGIPLLSRQDLSNVRQFVQALEALGYVDGKTVALEYHDADGRADRLPVVASEMTGLALDVIFAWGGDFAPIVKKATSTIPIVVVVSNDPVESGLVPSLGRPGGNVTGL